MKAFHPRKLFLFTSLNLADLFLTYQLLENGEGRVYESNPIAEAWLARYGWAGLVVFKLAGVLLVTGLCLFISLHRPRASGLVLVFSCTVLTAVVLYSCCLLGLNRVLASESFPDPPGALGVEAMVGREWIQAEDYGRMENPPPVQARPGMACRR